MAKASGERDLSNLPIGENGLSAYETAEIVVRDAGRMVIQEFNGVNKLLTRHKLDSSIVTEIDIAVEDATLSVLRREFPSFGVLGEESGSSAGCEPYTWLLDPIDGTRNFVNGVPHFAINLALVSGDNVLMGLTYDPIRDELFHAWVGGGAFLNGTPIFVSPLDQMAEATLACDMGHIDERSVWMIQMLEELWPPIQAVRIMGSAALGLAYMAAGRIDFYVNHNLKPWDLAAGLLLVREAGGIATDIQGPPATVYGNAVIASNTGLHAQFMRRTAGLRWRRIR